ncbi:MAG TPA: hypothetical protein PKD90_04820 [Phnomibacter sp.]|nr:hypothetical protein [Phnomibacter sp.]
MLDLLHTVEMPNNWIISLIVRNRQYWYENYVVTPLFYSVQQEGIELYPTERWTRKQRIL